MLPNISNRKPRIPKLSFTENSGYGWHVSYCDSVTGAPEWHCFGIPEREHKAEAERMYHEWITNTSTEQRLRRERVRKMP